MPPFIGSGNEPKFLVQWAGIMFRAASNWLMLPQTLDFLVNLNGW